MIFFIRFWTSFNLPPHTHTHCLIKLLFIFRSIETPLDQEVVVVSRVQYYEMIARKWDDHMTTAVLSFLFRFNPQSVSPLSSMKYWIESKRHVAQASTEEFGLFATFSDATISGQSEMLIVSPSEKRDEQRKKGRNKKRTTRAQYRILDLQMKFADISSLLSLSLLLFYDEYKWKSG